MRPLRELTLRSIRQRLLAKSLNAFEKYIVNNYRYYKASAFGHGITAYWWTGEINFGDLITPALLQAYGAIPILSNNPRYAQIAGCGSIIGMLPHNYSGIILGSGLGADTWKFSFPHARIMALRGNLTKSRLGIKRENVLLGDPGLLAGDLVNKKPIKKYKLGIVPHYVDYTNSLLWKLARRYPKTVIVINVHKNPSQVIYQVQKCENIISSSLHGLVVADALNIPNRWIILSEGILGKGFKFHDYYSAFEIEREPVILDKNMTMKDILAIMNDPPSGLKECQIALRTLFQKVVNELIHKSK